VKVEAADGVAYCEKCGGVFADVLEIGFQAGLGKPRKRDEGREITCPECLIAMQRQRIESAACVVDVCPSHGTWFDTGELEDVMRAFRRARQRGAHAPGVVPEAHNPSIAIVRREPPPREESLIDLVVRILR
jgi:Zn-finger nucleic acid-binding protein